MGYRSLRKNTIGEWRQRVDEHKVWYSGIKAEKESCERELERLETEIEITQKARAIIQKVGQETQQALQYRISELVNLALTAIFDDPYEFIVEFELKRGQTECTMLFSRDGYVFNPLDAAGGGVVDVASFALRLTCLTLIRPKPRNLLVLDEPFRFLSESLQPKAANLLKELSERLEIQILMITHNKVLVESADAIFEVSKDGQYSVIG